MRSSTVAVLATLAVLAISVNAAFVSTAAFSCMFPRVSSSRVNEYNGVLNNVLSQYGINTWNRVTMFMAQTGQETDHYNTFTEYTTGGVNPWCHNYEGGCRYLGRGAIQLTGLSNYRSCGSALGYDLVNNPTIVASNTQIAFASAGWYWKSRNLNSPADAGDILTATRIINGGTNGLAARTALYQTAKRCIPQFGGGGGPSPTPIKPSGCTPQTYTVKSGDTLAAIGARFGVSWQKICSANALKNCSQIYVGQRLTIPC